jgi:AcrR family transcriptional regulator
MAAGINQATLLYHFEDKEQLIVALVDELVARMRSFNDALPAQVAGALAAFEAHLRILQELFRTRPEIYVAFNEIAARAIRDPRIAMKLAAAEQDWMEFVASLLSVATPDTELSAINSVARATIVFVRGVAATAAGDGTLTALVERRAPGQVAFGKVRSAIDAYIALVRARFGYATRAVRTGRKPATPGA